MTPLPAAVELRRLARALRRAADAGECLQPTDMHCLALALEAAAAGLAEPPAPRVPLRAARDFDIHPRQ